MDTEDIFKKKIISLPGKRFYPICKSPKKIKRLKGFINQGGKVVIFKNVVNKKVLRTIINNRNNLLKKKPLFFKTFLGSKDLFIYNKLHKKSYVKGYYRKLELYPWNKRNSKIYSALDKILKVKFLMDDLKFNKKNFFDNKKFIKLQLTHYPPKKGFLHKHIDGTHKTIMVLQIGISKISKKNSKDGLFFYFNNRKKINIDQYIGTGDVAIFNPIIPRDS